MEASIGKALRDARLKLNLTIEEVAQATKIHADRLAELERDEYSRFPSLAYARNFLLLYSKYLGVDAAQYPVLDIGKPVFTADYQYLQGETVGSIRWTGPRRRKPIRRSRWLLAFGTLAAAITIGALTAFIILDFLRLPNLDSLLSKGETPENAEVATPSPAPAPAPTPTPAAVEPKLTPEAESPATAPKATPETNPEIPPELSDEALLSPEASLPPQTAGIPAPAETPSTEAGVPAEPATPDTAAAAPASPASPASPGTEPSATETVAPTPSPSPSPTPVVEAPEREIKVLATKRTKVKIVRDVAGSAPVYEGWLQAGKSYTLRAKQVWIESSTRGALKVTSDGKPVESPGASGTPNRSL